MKRNVSNDLCAVQAEGLQYRLRVCSTSCGFAVWAQVQPKYRLRVCSIGWARTAHPPPVLHTLISYGTPSACTGHPRPIWHTLSLYWTPSSHMAHPQPVLNTLIPYGTPSACTEHPRPIWHTLSLYWTPYTCTAHTLYRVHLKCSISIDSGITFLSFNGSTVLAK